MTPVYTTNIIRKDETYCVMEVEYFYPGKDTMTVGMPMAVAPDTEELMIQRYAPIFFVTPVVGSSEALDSTPCFPSDRAMDGSLVTTAENYHPPFLYEIISLNEEFKQMIVLYSCESKQTIEHCISWAPEGIPENAWVHGFAPFQMWSPELPPALPYGALDPYTAEGQAILSKIGNHVND